MDWRWCDVMLACFRIWNVDYARIQDALASVQTGAIVKRPKPTSVTPSDLRAQAEKLIADGMMPDLNTVLDVVEQIRREFQPKILEARRQAKIHVVRKTL
jgi:hypothetical protein